MSILNKSATLTNMVSSYDTFMQFKVDDTEVAYRITNFFRFHPLSNDEILYNDMVSICIKAYNRILFLQPGSYFRAVVVGADGTVAFDSNKCTLDQNRKAINRGTNIYSKYTTGTIEENHNTRPEIMKVLLSPDGFAQTFITRYNKRGEYSNYLAVRQGNSTALPNGTVRISFLSYYPPKP
jgi:hypothetical protein